MKNYLYDCQGRAVADILEDGGVFGISGGVLAFLKGEYVYSFSGLELGTLENGWVRDLDGACVLFAKGATSPALVKPIRQVAPVPAVPMIHPIKPATMAL